MAAFDLRLRLANRPLALHRAALAGIEETAKARALSERDGARLQSAAKGRDAAGGSVQRAGDIAIIPLVGLVTDDPFLAWLTGDGTTIDGFAMNLRQAVRDPAVKGVLIVINSPGGGVELVQEAATEIRSARASKPVVSIARTLCASAAFWLGAQAHELVASPSAEIGSVGVFAVHIDESRSNERAGLLPTYVSAGRFKTEWNPDSPLSADAKTFMQSRVDATYAQFVADLARGRRTTEAKVRSDFGDGRLFGAAEAVRRGMADRIDTIEGVLASLASKTGARGAMRAHATVSSQRSLDDMDFALRLAERM